MAQYRIQAFGDELGVKGSHFQHKVIQRIMERVDSDLPDDDRYTVNMQSFQGTQKEPVEGAHDQLILIRFIEEYDQIGHVVVGHVFMAGSSLSADAHDPALLKAIHQAVQDAAKESNSVELDGKVLIGDQEESIHIEPDHSDAVEDLISELFKEDK